MVIAVAGPPLTKFAGQSQPRHVISGPGEDALKMFAGNDLTTWLVSTGVVDCAILTILLSTTRPGGGVIGGYRPGGAQAMARGVIRAMAHYNGFNGPSVPAIAALFNSCLAGQTATVNDLKVSISFHAGSHRPYTQELVTVVGQAVPLLNSLTTHSYGAAAALAGQTGVARRGNVTLLGKTTKNITIYLSPTGQLSASQE
jgi:hypothetical protein